MIRLAHADRLHVWLCFSQVLRPYPLPAQLFFVFGIESQGEQCDALDAELLALGHVVYRLGQRVICGQEGLVDTALGDDLVGADDGIGGGGSFRFCGLF